MKSGKRQQRGRFPGYPWSNTILYIKELAGLFEGAGCSEILTLEFRKTVNRTVAETFYMIENNIINAAVVH